MKGARRAFVWALPALALGAAAWLCVTRVPEGNLGLQMRGGEARALLGPGLRFHAPFDAVVPLPAGREEYSGTALVKTREGAALAVPFRLEIDFARAEPASLTSLGRKLASGGEAAVALTQVVQESAEAAGSGGEPPSREAIAARLAGIGLIAGSLTFGEARAAARGARDNPLRASYAPPASPILLIGVDSADWDLMGPLIDSGALPNLKALRDRGAWGTLRSMKPTLSPILWTTMATGRPPEEHGVIDFLMRDPATGAEVPISRLFRRVKALWNIASDLDITSLTVAWWATWPAERVKGEMVTDRVSYSLFDLPLGEGQPAAVYPPALEPEVDALKVDPDSVAYEDLRAIVEIPPERFDRARRALDSLDGYRDPVSHLIRIIASTQTYRHIATSLLKRRPHGLALVYFEGLDEVNHRFAHYMPPAMGLVKGSDPGLAAAFAEAVPNFYRLQDTIIGELVRASSPGTVVMVVSDHGFANGAERPIDLPPDIEGQPGLWHTLDGVFLAAGPPIRPGRLEAPVTLLDVAPTLLALLGLPPAADMPGRAIAEIFRPGGAPPLPDVAVASYDEIGEPLQTLGSGASSAQDAEMIAKLAALGYLQSGEGSAASTGTPTYHINAGQILLSKNQLDLAEREFHRARELAPRYDQPLLGLAQVRLARGRPAEALPFLEEALNVAQDLQPVLLTRAARVYAMAGQQRRGIEFLEGLRMQGRREAYRLTAIGMLREGAGDASEAAEVYREALRIDPSVERALRGVYALMKKEGKLDELAEILRNSTDVESLTVSVRAANWLALTRELQGDEAEARSILSAALSRAPEDLMTLNNLGSLLVRGDRSAEGLPYLQRAYQRHPKNFELLVNLIVAHGKLGDLAAARRFFREGEAVAQRPAVYNAIAYACFLNGQRKDANVYLTRSLAMDPSQKEARRLKEEIDRAGGK